MSDAGDVDGVRLRRKFEMINFVATLIALSVYILVWDKIPYWARGFNKLLDKSPGWVRGLYAHWRCPFCVAFWLALILYLTFGLVTLPELSNHVGQSIKALRWLAIFLDCLSCATLVYLSHLVMSALLASTLRGHEIRADYQKSIGSHNYADEQCCSPN